MLHKYAMGIIGNGSWLALINDYGNVTWLCWPKFDSSFLFGNLLDKVNGGDFNILPDAVIASSSQTYIPITNILQTHIKTVNGSYTITDFAPIYKENETLQQPHIYIRKISPVDGHIKLKVVCEPTMNYGKDKFNRIIKTNVQIFTHQQESKFLYSSSSMGNLKDNFSLIEPLFLVFSDNELALKDVDDYGEKMLELTANYWKSLVQRLRLPSEFQMEVIRSALTLYLHVYTSGATIAAATSSLPEFLGSTRNWDYRYCWMRDSFYTLLAFNKLNDKHVLINYAKYISQIHKKYKERWPPLHAIALDIIPVEVALDLEGYLSQKPVRMGNQAFEHIQNDIYGQVIATLLPYFSNEAISLSKRKQYLPIIHKMVNMIEYTMDEPDNGLWEFRGLKQFHCYTFLFHWVGCRTAMKIAALLNDSLLGEKAASTLTKAQSKIEACYDENSGLYYQAIGSRNLDASLLQLITLGYLSPDNPKADRLLTAIEKSLSADNGLFYRYLHEDDFGKPDSTFLICAFWYIEALAILGCKEKAISNLNKVLKCSNHLFLFSEDVHAQSGSQWGNFPQTYSHAGFIHAVYAIENPKMLPFYT
jgi:GH15 family glucan-1,4-alpha-glucosidase